MEACMITLDAVCSNVEHVHLAPNGRRNQHGYRAHTAHFDPGISLYAIHGHSCLNSVHVGGSYS
jgi:hypothetical protein